MAVSMPDHRNDDYLRMRYSSNFDNGPMGSFAKPCVPWVFVMFCGAMILGGIVAVTSCQIGTDSIGGSLPGTWEGRIEYSLRQVTGEYRSDGADMASQVEMAASALAIAGKVDRALELVNEHITNERLKWIAIQFVAARSRLQMTWKVRSRPPL